MNIVEKGNNSLQNLLKMEGFKAEIYAYARSRNLSSQEVFQVLEKAINETFQSSELEILKDLTVSYKQNSLLITNSKQQELSSKDLDLGSLYNHLKFQLEKNIFKAFRNFQIEKLRESVEFSNSLYEIEVLRLGSNFLIGELVSHHGAEVWIEEFHLIRKDRIKVGDRLKILLRDELMESETECRYTGTRRGENYLSLLLKEVVPEIEEETVKIDLIVREEGVKSYIVVSSTNLFVNPIKSVIGPGASRIKEIKKNLPERLEILELKQDLKSMIEEVFGKYLINYQIDSEKESIAIQLLKVSFSSFPRLELRIIEHFFPNIEIKWTLIEENNL